MQTSLLKFDSVAESAGRQLGGKAVAFVCASLWIVWRTKGPPCRSWHARRQEGTRVLRVGHAGRPVTIMNSRSRVVRRPQCCMQIAVAENEEHSQRTQREYSAIAIPRHTYINFTTSALAQPHRVVHILVCTRMTINSRSNVDSILPNASGLALFINSSKLKIIRFHGEYPPPPPPSLPLIFYNKNNRILLYWFIQRYFWLNLTYSWSRISFNQFTDILLIKKLNVAVFLVK